jgi:hypothetical protein
MRHTRINYSWHVHKDMHTHMGPGMQRLLGTSPRNVSLRVGLCASHNSKLHRLQKRCPCEHVCTTASWLSDIVVHSSKLHV